jgi:hypothetical protein
MNVGVLPCGCHGYLDNPDEPSLIHRPGCRTPLPLPPPDIHQALALLRHWRRHIRDVYDRRGRPEVYVPGEAMHTCHGCGAGAGLIQGGLCPGCQAAFAALCPREAP